MVDKDQVIDGTAKETSLFRGRRLRKLRTEISGVLNINPFLMRALKDFHQINDLPALANFMLSWHLGNGHATSFGKMIDERILPSVFGTQRLDSTCRDVPPYNLEPFDDIDHIVKRHDGDYLLSLKASAWTIQLGQAMGLYNHFHSLIQQDQQKSGIVVGVYYGHKGLLTDKYRIVCGENVRRQDIMTRLDCVAVRAGEQFWSWLNDDERQTQVWLLEGVMKGAEQFRENTPEMREVVGGAANRLVEELKKKYGLAVEGGIDWFLLLHSINDDKGEDIGTEPVEPSLPPK
ncbi:MAG: PDDEXK family nuclease [Gemmataceae bacterium]